MRVIDKLDEMTESARGWVAGGKVGFVFISSEPHQGHLSLIQEARDASEISVVSIIDKTLLFDVAKTQAQQTGNQEDTLRVLGNMGVSVVFIPRLEDMYPPTFSTFITPGGVLAHWQEGTDNPSSTRRFATTMTKLFQLVRADIAFFGQKDAQQTAMLRQLVRDLNIDVSLRILPTVRESDGLALSSRNRNLSLADRQFAPAIYQALLKAKERIEAGANSSQVIEKVIRDALADVPQVRLEYIIICHPETLNRQEKIAPGTIVIVGAYIGNVQLFDNICWQTNGQWSI